MTSFGLKSKGVVDKSIAPIFTPAINPKRLNLALGRCGWKGHPTLLEAKFFSDFFRREPGLILVFGATVGHQLGKLFVPSGALDFDGEILAVANLKPLPRGDGGQYKPLAVCRLEDDIPAACLFEQVIQGFCP
jgi:hypothetical protein